MKESLLFIFVEITSHHSVRTLFIESHFQFNSISLFIYELVVWALKLNSHDLYLKSDVKNFVSSSTLIPVVSIFKVDSLLW